MTDLDLTRYGRILWKWLWVVIAATAIAGVASYQASMAMPRTFVTATTLMVGENTAAPNLSTQDMQTSQRIAAVYAPSVRRQPVLQATIDQLGLQESWAELRNRVFVSRGQDSQFVEIRVTDTDPERARITADELARQMIIQSPTAESMQQLEARRAFLRRQLDNLQGNIQAAEVSLSERQEELDTAGGARTVLAVQDSIEALDRKLSTWRSTYASLLNSYEGKSPNVITVVESAYLPTSFSSPDVRANVLFAMSIGFLLALGTIFLLEYLTGDRVGTSEQATKALEQPILGSIPSLAKDAKKAAVGGLVTLRQPQSPDAEAYRVLRTNVQFATRGREGVALLVTSPAGGEGKSVTSANLAVSFAQAGKATILVDADLRKPSVHRLFGLENDRGLSSIFLGSHVPRVAAGEEDEARWDQASRRWLDGLLMSSEVPSLRILLSGRSLPANPGELLAGEEMAAVLRELRTTSDVVIVDSPPVEPVADTSILAGLGFDVLVVAESGKTRSQEALRAIDALRRTQARILGVVLSKTPRRPARIYRSWDKAAAAKKVQAPAGA